MSSDYDDDERGAKPKPEMHYYLDRFDYPQRHRGELSEYVREHTKAITKDEYKAAREKLAASHLHSVIAYVSYETRKKIAAEAKRRGVTTKRLTGAILDAAFAAR